MTNNNRKFNRLMSLALFMFGSLAANTVVEAQTQGSEQEACSDRTLNGDYGFTIEGVILPASAPLRGVALTHFDGKGKLNQVDHVIFDGIPPAQQWTPGLGTYHVNADCTGTAHINIPSTNDFVNLRIVVVKNGKEIHTVVTAPFNGPSRTVTALGVRVD